jgi:hypothetical protein
MATNLPEDFFSWKSFQSLTQTAAIAWMLILITDAIFVMRISDEYRQLISIWIAGLGICFLLACIRLYYKEVKEKGDYLLIIFNTVLIFLYASGFSGFTKELGNWSKVKETLSSEKLSEENNFTCTLASFVPDIFSNQTAFYPDVKRIEENNILVKENKHLIEKNIETENKIKLITMADNGGAKTMDSLINENSKLRKNINELTEENSRLKNLPTNDGTNDKATMLIDKLTKDNKKLNEVNGQLNARLNECLSKNGQQASKEIEQLQKQIAQHNTLVDEFQKCLSDPDYKGNYDRFTRKSNKLFNDCTDKAVNLLNQKIGK